jgi:hypothetical protein
MKASGHPIVRRVLHGGVLLEDDVLLAGKLAGVEHGAGEDVAEDVEGDVRVLREHPRRVARPFVVGRGVDLAADVLDVLGDAAGGAARRALEGHVLDEVGQAVLVGLLVARARADPDAQRRGGDLRHRSVATVRPLSSRVMSTCLSRTKCRFMRPRPWPRGRARG